VPATRPLGFKLKVNVAGAVPDVADSDAPGIPLTMASNARDPLVSVMFTGMGDGAGAVRT
jgi:hypothetical protein